MHLFTNPKNEFIHVVPFGVMLHQALKKPSTKGLSHFDKSVSLALGMRINR